MRTTVMSARALRTPKERDDREGPLVEALRRRDADAAERLVTTYQSRAYRLAVGIAATAEDAEEVVQDANVENLSCAEIAEVLHLGVGGVKTRVHRARLFIRKRSAESLSGRFLGPPVESPDQRGKRPW